MCEMNKSLSRKFSSHAFVLHYRADEQRERDHSESHIFGLREPLNRYIYREFHIDCLTNQKNLSRRYQIANSRIVCVMYTHNRSILNRSVRRIQWSHDLQRKPTISCDVSIIELLWNKKITQINMSKGNYSLWLISKHSAPSGFLETWEVIFY